MAALPSMTHSTSTLFRTVILLTVSVASTATEVIVLYARNAWERTVSWLEGPSLHFPRIAPKLLPSVLERIVASVTAPVLEAEPSFVGGGLAYRRWR
jgi:hypothetical protein